MAAANKEPLTILGAIFVRLSDPSEDSEGVSTGALVYVSTDTDKFYLSREVLKDMKVIDQNFPCIPKTQKTEAYHGRTTQRAPLLVVAPLVQHLHQDQVLSHLNVTRRIFH